jgi:hypothetical protein
MSYPKSYKFLEDKMKKLHFLWVTLLLAIFAGTLLTGCGISKKNLEKSVGESVFEWADERSPFVMYYVDTTLIKTDKYTYVGEVEMGIGEETRTVTVYVSVDGDAFRWEADADDLAMFGIR